MRPVSAASSDVRCKPGVRDANEPRMRPVFPGGLDLFVLKARAFSRVLSLECSRLLSRRGVVGSAGALVILLVMNGANAATAPTGVRLVAQSFSLTTPNLQSGIWTDKIAGMLKFKRHLQAVATGSHIALEGTAFTAALKRGSQSFVVSVLDNGCGSTSVENSISCPARIVELVDGKPRLVAELPEVFVALVPGPIGTETNAQSAFQNRVALDASGRAVNFSVVYNGEQKPGPTVSLN